ncbi:MAG: 5-formyltetrahydrofolate cyclo-ligase [Sulfurifustaceae bacterium]
MASKRRKHSKKRVAPKTGKRRTATRVSRKKKTLTKRVARKPAPAKKKARPTRVSSSKTGSLPIKIELRRRLRARRSQLTAEEQRFAAERVAANLAATRAFRVSRRIACYYPSDGEIDPRPILARIARMRKQAFLPVLSRLTSNRLWFAPFTSDTELRPNRFGILEPQVEPARLVRAEDLDLLLLPLVAFDPKGNRLGRGAGYYDRSLAFRRYRRHMRKPHLLGLAHDFQRVPALPIDAWDVPLDGIVTDRSVYDTAR